LLLNIEVNKVRKHFADVTSFGHLGLIPAVVLAGLILRLYAWTNIMFVDEDEDTVVVIELYAQQFNWKARYSGDDNVLGKANVRYIEGANVLVLI
jgi:cytochrome c oxidase subunit 2